MKMVKFIKIFIFFNLYFIFCFSLCYALECNYSGENPVFLNHLKIGNTYSFKKYFPYFPTAKCDQVVNFKFEIVKPNENIRKWDLHQYEPIPSTNWFKINKRYYSKVRPNKKISPNITIKIPNKKRYLGKSFWAKLKVRIISDDGLISEHEWEIYINISCESKEILPIYQEGHRILNDAEKFKSIHEYDKAIEKFSEYLIFYEKNEKKIKSIDYEILPEEAKNLFPLPAIDDIKLKIKECEQLLLIPKTAWEKVEKENFSEELFEEYMKFLGIDGHRSFEDYHKEEIYKFDSFRGKKFISAILKKIKETDNPVLKYRLIRKLGYLGDTSVVEFLREIVKNKENPPPVRWCAVEAIGKLKDKGSTDILISALYDEVFGIRLQAIKALGQICDSSILPVLKEALRNIKDADLIRQINKSISEITGNDFEYINYELGISLKIPKDWEIEWFPFEGNFVRINGPVISGTYATIKIRKEENVIKELEELRIKKGNEPTFKEIYPKGEKIKIGELFGIRSFRLQEAGPSWKFKNFKQMGITLFSDNEKYFIECSSPEEAFENVLPQFEKIIKTFRLISIEDIGILNSISIDTTERWKEWLNKKFKSKEKIQLEHNKKLENKLKKLLCKEKFQFFSDINNDGKFESLIFCLGSKPEWDKKIQMISALIIMSYAENKQDWEELVRLDQKGLFINGTNLFSTEDEFQVKLGIDRNNNLHFIFMVGTASDEVLIHWKPFKKTYYADYGDSGCDDD